MYYTSQRLQGITAFHDCDDHSQVKSHVLPWKQTVFNRSAACQISFQSYHRLPQGARRHVLGFNVGWQLSSCSMSWHVFTVFRPGWCPNAHRHGLSHFIPQELLCIDRIFGDIAICAYFIEIYTHCMNYCKLSIVRFLVFYSVESTNFWSPLLHRHTLHFLKPFE